MNNYGLTNTSKKQKALQFKKHLKTNTRAFLVILLLPFIICLLFTFGFIKGHKTIGPEYAVALLDANGSFGSAFRISETKVLTAKHVVDHLTVNDEVTLIFKKFSPPIETQAKILFMPTDGISNYASSFNDYAVLELLEYENLQNIPELPLGISEGLETREKVYAIGYPVNNPENKVTDGIISATSFSSKSNEYDFLLDVNVDVDNGNSGGPLVLEATQEAIGIMILVNEGNHTKANLALKIDKVRGELERLGSTVNLDL
ncbi:S1 family peptidase [Flavivirga spongiicola]|uniref:Serine protease n=1 Tax=Flavivirga spongiicola TaxID=421621 RepID=A0ABU7XZT3_9FLAO|nr:serine protease [Flavivirga sp. MEBiC05379]MDO5980945.1 serine protease [Flavivirga sp. MEBiC05379]